MLEFVFRDEAAPILLVDPISRMALGMVATPNLPFFGNELDCE